MSNSGGYVWSELRDSGELEELQPSTERCTGTCVLGGRRVELEISLPPRFPLAPPHIKLRSNHEPLPHVSPEGVVCYTDAQGLHLDATRPGRVVLDAIKLAKRLIAEGFSGANHSAFYEELEANWGIRDASTKSTLSSIKPGGEAARIRAWFEPDTAVPSLLEPEHIEESVELGCRFRSKRARSEWGLYVPLDRSPALLPSPADSAWGMERLRRIISECTSEATQQQLEHLASTRANRYVVAFGVDLGPEAGTCLFGVQIERRASHAVRARGMSRHPLLARVGESSNWCVTPLLLHRIDRQHLVERGGGHVELCDKSILFAGVGAVGSVLAEQLARAGIGSLTLVDPDQSSLENTFRHSLGMASPGRWKVKLVRDHLVSRYPYLDAVAFPLHIDTLMERYPDSWWMSRWATPHRPHDLVILATGEPTVEMHISRAVHREPEAPALLHTWLEPMGIGGHALLSHTSHDASGCYGCLHDPEQYECAPHNAASLAAPGQRFSRRISGCATAFVPYGARHATRTACEAADLAIAFLRGKSEGNPLITWKGEPSDFLKRGLELAPRYHLTPDQLHESRLAYHSLTCSICGPERGEP